MRHSLEVVPIPGLPEIGSGDRLGELIAGALAGADLEPRDDDVVTVAQKAVSKAEGRVRSLDEVAPGPKARRLAERLGKDSRLVELILSESRSIVRAERDLLIVETLSGWICANAGIDSSNVPGSDRVTLLPQDPDGSARRIRAELGAATGARPAVVVTDSFGRPWRLGQVEVAIGSAGLAPLDDWRGRIDREGTKLAATVVAVADQAAGAADLARAKDAGLPFCLVRGLGRFVSADDGPGARAIQRPEVEDLFR
jgi:coenzyme F420-0:L-glutamate ligase / coenzyme F420-1:gamma-L-glutamate ligase